jgi:hypothetical protein
MKSDIGVYVSHSMQALAFWRTVVADQTDFLSRVIELLTEQGIRYWSSTPRRRLRTYAFRQAIA